MISILDPLRNINFLTALLRMLLAFVCGGVIGLERSYKNRPAGFRTHILICVASALASMTGLYLYLNAGLPTDISRLGAQVVSGLGFIGGGTIIVTRKKTIRGLTTAAGLWASGIIGLAVGAGYYEGGLIATVLVLVTEIWISKLAKRIAHSPEFRITLHYRHKPALDTVLRYCKDHKLAISNLQVTGSAGDEESPVYTAVISLRPRQVVDQDRLVAHIRAVHGVSEVEAVELPPEEV